MKKKKSFQKKSGELTGNELTGLVIAHFGRRAEVEDQDKKIWHCHVRKNLEPSITGDHVFWQREDENAGVIVNIQPRTSLLARQEKNKTKLIAANIDVIIIVTAPPPVLSHYLIDRYLVAAEHLAISPVILLNKIDLLAEHNRDEINTYLAVYEKIGYPILLSSTYQADGLHTLNEFLKNKNCVLVGPSGVGKSSIISSLTDEPSIVTNDTSDAGLGKHTTTTTRLYHLPEGGSLIDSPGVREFELGYLDENDILRGFTDFTLFLNQCKFRNCRHQKEPGCALLQAVAENKISASRWTSYLEMIANKNSR